MRLDAYAERFADAGYHVLVFDYRGFGESDGTPRRVVNVDMQHADWRAAIAFARSQTGVDATKTVLWGSSLSGGHVLALASEGLGVAAVIAQVPHIDSSVSAREGGTTRWSSLALHAAWDQAAGLLGAPPHYVPASGKPGCVAFMNAPEAAGYLRLVPDGFEFDQSIAARSLFSLMNYSPGRTASRISVPTLVQVASDDETTPASAAISAVERMPMSELKTYQTDHFSPYLGDTFEAFVADQVAFLERHVPVAD
ncbi:MAG: alpha/beta hydrolase [bacterium]|nr:alpha/beta hydrolase [bacterium]